MTLHPLCPVLLAALCAAAQAAPGAQGPSFAVQSRLDADYPSLDALYKDLHAHPELSLMEEKTSARMAAELRSAGFDVTEKFGGTGVVGVLRNGPGPTLLIRTDMDALPVKEETGLPYASVVRAVNLSGTEVPVMHACGHDIHMTVFIGTARMLAGMRDQWSGTLVLVGQPAEEMVVGARNLLTAGLYRQFPKPDFAVGLHDEPQLATGTVGFAEGFFTSNSDSVEIVVRGIGGHGSRPENAKDPVVLAAQIVLALQTIVSREIHPGDRAVVTVGTIHGGTRSNIIPSEVKLGLTLRSYASDVREHLVASIRRICRGEAEAADVHARAQADVLRRGEGLDARFGVAGCHSAGAFSVWPEGPGSRRSSPRSQYGSSAPAPGQTCSSAAREGACPCAGSPPTSPAPRRRA